MLWGVINKKDTWKIQCGSTKWNVQYIVYEQMWKLKYEFVDVRINWFT